MIAIINLIGKAPSQLNTGIWMDVFELPNPLHHRRGKRGGGSTEFLDDWAGEGESVFGVIFVKFFLDYNGLRVMGFAALGPWATFFNDNS